MSMTLWLHTASDTSNTFKFEHTYTHSTALLTYELFIQQQHDTRSIRSTNEDQQQAVIAVIVVFVDSETAYIWGCLKLWPHNTASNANKPFIQVQASVHARSNANVRAVRARPTRHHSTNEDQRRIVIAIVVHLDSKMAHACGWYYPGCSYCIEH